MKTFAKNLKDLMDENAIDVKSLTEQIGLPGTSMIYRWLNDERGLLLSTAVKFADFFHCSLDYLFGRSDRNEDVDFQECPPFDIQFRKVLKEQKISQYRLTKDKVLSFGHIDGWLKSKQTPHIESIVKLANYLNVSMDYLVGREK